MPDKFIANKFFSILIQKKRKKYWRFGPKLCKKGWNFVLYIVILQNGGYRTILKPCNLECYFILKTVFAILIKKLKVQSLMFLIRKVEILEWKIFLKCVCIVIADGNSKWRILDQFDAWSLMLLIFKNSFYDFGEK